MEISAKQKRFVDEYLIDLNATQAAIRAGYSKNTANEQGSRLLANVKVKASIDAAIAARSERTGIDAAWVLKRLVAEAEADLGDLYDDNGDLKPVKEWPLIWRQGLVIGVDVNALFEGYGEDRIQIGEVKKLKGSDRIRRIELIGKHVAVNAFQEQVAVTGLDKLAERLERASKRDV